jgi:sugar phosphate isomerase/epimerase
MFTLFDAGENFYRVQKKTEELVPLIKKYNIEGINPSIEILEDRSKARHAMNIVLNNGIRWGLLPTPVDMLSPNINDEQFDKALEKLKFWAETGELIGIDRCYNHVFPGHNEFEYEENFERHIIRIRRINHILSACGIHYGLEFLGPRDLRDSFAKPFVHTLAGVLALADTVDPSVGFVFDTFHWFTGGNNDDLYYAACNVERMLCFHVNDGIAGKGPDEQFDMDRAMPMTTGVIDSLKAYKLFYNAG